jgi:hypothetical protein
MDWCVTPCLCRSDYEGTLPEKQVPPQVPRRSYWRLNFPIVVDV